uniref:Uncharacterized protein n=1 Tax=Opuntia streptacantha TaxID=393608 RepID=A0A7C9D7Z6_OPUST
MKIHLLIPKILIIIVTIRPLFVPHNPTQIMLLISTTHECSIHSRSCYCCRCKPTQILSPLTPSFIIIIIIMIIKNTLALNRWIMMINPTYIHPHLNIPRFLPFFLGL